MLIISIIIPTKPLSLLREDMMEKQREFALLIATATAKPLQRANAQILKEILELAIRAPNKNAEIDAANLADVTEWIAETQEPPVAMRAPKLLVQ
jgi:hypothetical protein